MNRIDLPHLLWALESIDEGNVINRITVEEAMAENAIFALERMLANA
jgi:quinolinate synthase